LQLTKGEYKVGIGGFLEKSIHHRYGQAYRYRYEDRPRQEKIHKIFFDINDEGKTFCGLNISLGDNFRRISKSKPSTCL